MSETGLIYIIFCVDLSAYGFWLKYQDAKDKEHKSSRNKH